MRESAIGIMLETLVTAAIANYNTNNPTDLLPPSLQILADWQPRQAGIPSTAAVFFHNILHDPIGWPERKDVWDCVAETMTHTEHQRIESTYQFGALVPQSPGTQDAMTAADVLSIVKTFVQSESAIAAFAAAGVGVLRVKPIRNTNWFSDEMAQNEENPSFDMIITHGNGFNITIDVIEVFRATFYAV